MTARRGTKGLTTEDRILWHKVARSVKPLPGVELEPVETIEPEPPALPQVAPGPASVPPFISAPQLPKPATRPRPTGLDDRTHGRIAKGRLSIEARIDLHGLTQAEAHGRLLGFLRQAHASGLRHVLVITGKGTSKGGDGVLRRAVPGWLATAPFAGLVGAHAEAARQHGGEGALYLRLRRAGPAG